MNAAIRAVVRCGIDRGWTVLGVRRGYTGLIAGELAPLGARDVGGIIQLGGTMLHSARLPAFAQEEVQRLAIDSLARHHVEALVVIGGNGSQAGTYALSRLGFPVVGVASTIDNDLYGSEMTLGADTALSIALEAIDRLKTTAVSHQRGFLVEVMGRDCGYLALMAGLAGGVDAIVVPEVDVDPEAVAADLRAAYDRGKAHAIAVVSEGARLRAETLARYFYQHRKRLGFELRVTTLGHVQRGGSPGAFDRVLGTRLGAGAVDRLARGEHGVLVGWLRGEVAATPLSEVAARPKPLDTELLELARVLAK
jgi:6-phosphofructokinase 1